MLEESDDEKALRRAKEDERRGDAPSTQAGEFVREEIHHVRAGKHGARSTKQAIAIGLSKARRAGVKLPPPGKGRASDETRKQAERDLSRGRKGPRTKKSAKRSRASMQALKREGRAAATHNELAKQGRRAAAKRGPTERSATAKKAARTRARDR